MPVKKEKQPFHVRPELGHNMRGLLSAGKVYDFEIKSVRLISA
jgi:hypothetical protein